jgi:hypothetical protein
MSLATDLASFVRGEVFRAQQPVTAVGTVVASPDDQPVGSDRLLVAVDGSSLAAPVKRARGLLLLTGMRVGLVRFGADWVATIVIVDPVVDSLAGTLTTFFINKTTPHTSSVTNTEAICQQLQFDAVPYGVYLALWMGTWASTVSGDVVRLRLRLQEGGGAVTASSQELIIQTQVAQVSSQSEGLAVMAPIVPAGPGPCAVAGSIVRAAGTGSCTVAASATDMEAICLLRTG